MRKETCMVVGYGNPTYVLVGYGNTAYI